MELGSHESEHMTMPTPLQQSMHPVLPLQQSMHAVLPPQQQHSVAKLKLLSSSGNGGAAPATTPMDQAAAEAREILRPALVVVQQQAAAGSADAAVRGLDLESALTARVKKGTVRYRECQKNHAANIGGHAIDGCGEFMPGGQDGTADALRCAACDCHRNFHRREVEGEPVCECRRNKKPFLPAAAATAGVGAPTTATTTLAATPTTTAALALLPAAAVQIVGARPTAAAPATMALTAGAAADTSDEQDGGMRSPPSALKKRFRTKFSTEQKEKMHAFADKLGWKMQKHDDAAVHDFCTSAGVKRHVLKVWMHNNKHTLGKKP